MQCQARDTGRNNTQPAPAIGTLSLTWGDLIFLDMTVNFPRSHITTSEGTALYGAPATRQARRKR